MTVLPLLYILAALQQESEKATWGAALPAEQPAWPDCTSCALYLLMHLPPAVRGGFDFYPASGQEPSSVREAKGTGPPSGLL